MWQIWEQDDTGFLPSLSGVKRLNSCSIVRDMSKATIDITAIDPIV